MMPTELYMIWSQPTSLGSTHATTPLILSISVLLHSKFLDLLCSLLLPGYHIYHSLYMRLLFYFRCHADSYMIFLSHLNTTSLGKSSWIQQTGWWCFSLYPQSTLYFHDTLYTVKYLTLIFPANALYTSWGQGLCLFPSSQQSQSLVHRT